MRANFALKFLDRYLGIPLIFLIGKFIRKRPFPHLSENPKIGLLQTAAIGDTILASGAIADIKNHWPKSTVTFFTGESNYQAAKLIPDVDVVLLPVASPAKALTILKSDSFDLWIDFGAWPRINALYSFLSDSKYRIGFQTPNQYRHYVYDQAVLHQPIHELENIRNLIKLTGVACSNSPKLVPMAFEQKNQIALHLYAGGSQAAHKEWPEEKWIQLINRLGEQGFSIVLTGAKADAVRCELVKSKCQPSTQIEIAAGKLSLKESAELLLSSKAVITIDTGIMHLAAALGCLTIALHGPTSYKRWGGIGPRIIPLRESKTAPWIHLGFENPPAQASCMDLIPVELVLKTLEDNL